MRSEVKGEVPAVSRNRRTEPGHRESRGLPMPGEGSNLWREHERSIAPSRPVHYLDVREVKAPSRLKENLSQSDGPCQWPSDFAHVPRTVTYPVLLLYFAAPLSHCPA